MTKTIYSYMICYKDGISARFKSLQNLNFSPSTNPILTIDSVDDEGVLISRATIASSEIRSLTMYNG